MTAIKRPNTPAYMALLRRLHFYIGLLIGPFLAVAALSGMAYALTPQLEGWLYADVLHSSNRGPAKPLDQQINSALQAAGHDAVITAVRPAPAVGDTTRVMFTDSSHGPSESRAVFVDPATAQVLGELNVYGTSGVLPYAPPSTSFTAVCCWVSLVGYTPNSQRHGYGLPRWVDLPCGWLTQPPPHAREAFASCTEPQGCGCCWALCSSLQQD